MIFCDGIFIVMVRNITRVICSKIGIKKIRPGPRTPVQRPSKKMTPRSYSLTMRSDNRTKNMTTPPIIYSQGIVLLLYHAQGQQSKTNGERIKPGKPPPNLFFYTTLTAFDNLNHAK